MKFAVLGALALVAVSCRGIPVSPEAQLLVPDVKAKRFDKAAADPDHLAEACVAAMRELETEGADSRLILEVADFFFDNYPMTVRDLPIDESTFEAAAHLRHGALVRMKPALKSCEAFDKASTLQDMIETMRSWNGSHDDGGRCIRKIYDLCLQLRTLGFDWPEHAHLDRDPKKTRGYEDGLIQDLFKSALSTQPDNPYVPLIALTAARFSDAAEAGRRLQALQDFWELKSSARWSR